MAWPGFLLRVKAAIKVSAGWLERPASKFPHVVGYRTEVPTFLPAVGWSHSQLLEHTLRSLTCVHLHRQCTMWQFSPSRSAGNFFLLLVGPAPFKSSPNQERSTRINSLFINWLGNISTSVKSIHLCHIMPTNHKHDIHHIHSAAHTQRRGLHWGQASRGPS